VLFEDKCCSRRIEEDILGALMVGALILGSDLQGYLLGYLLQRYLLSCAFCTGGGWWGRSGIDVWGVDVMCAIYAMTSSMP